MKVAIVGCGGISHAHFNSWRRMEDVTIVGVCDVRPECMTEYVNACKAHPYEDCRTMLETEKPDILDICLPTYLHVKYSLMALEMGINVVCEKPISLKREDVALVYGTAKKHNCKFMVAQVLRFWPEFSELKEIIETERYGKLLSGEMHRLGYRPNWSWNGWMTKKELSGMVPYDLHIHDLDWLVYALGAPKSAVRYRAERPDQDFLHAVYDYGDYFIMCDSSWFKGKIPWNSGFRFQFEEAVVINNNGSLAVYDKDGTAQEGVAAADSGVLNLPTTDAYYNELRYFADCVKENRDPDRVKPEELETVIDLLNAF